MSHRDAPEARDISTQPRRPAIVGRQARRSESTRRVLLLAGRALFSEKGLYESRVEEITERADIGKGTLYRYFRSKEDLIVAVVAAGFDDLRRSVSEVITGSEGMEARVEAIVRAHVAFFAGNQDLMRIFHQVRGMLKFNRPEWKPLRASLEAHLAFLSAAVRDAAGAERMTARQGRELSILMFGTISGVLSVRVAVDPKAKAEGAMVSILAALGSAAPVIAGGSTGAPARRSRGLAAPRTGERRR